MIENSWNISNFIGLGALMLSIYNTYKQISENQPKIEVYLEELEDNSFCITLENKGSKTANNVKVSVNGDFMANLSALEGMKKHFDCLHQAIKDIEKSNVSIACGQKKRILLAPDAKCYSQMPFGKLEFKYSYYTKRGIFKILNKGSFAFDKADYRWMYVGGGNFDKDIATSLQVMSRNSCELVNSINFMRNKSLNVVGDILSNENKLYFTHKSKGYLIIQEPIELSINNQMIFKYNEFLDGRFPEINSFGSYVFIKLIFIKDNYESAVDYFSKYTNIDLIAFCRKTDSDDYSKVYTIFEKDKIKFDYYIDYVDVNVIKRNVIESGKDCVELTMELKRRNS